MPTNSLVIWTIKELITTFAIYVRMIDQDVSAEMMQRHWNYLRKDLYQDRFGEQRTKFLSGMYVQCQFILDIGADSLLSNSGRNDCIY